MKTTIRNSIGGLLLIPLVLICFGLSPTARAVVPAPDGGYPGFNTAEGQNALFNLTIGGGFWDTAIGAQALHNATTGSFNTAVGLNALYFNNGNNNVAVGSQTLQQNLTGGSNVGVGLQALYNNSSGNMNTAVGHQALFGANDFNNTAVGFRALASNPTNLNTAVGSGAMASASGGLVSFNTAVGWNALSKTTANANVAVGDLALENLGSGEFNTAIGAATGSNLTTGSNNIYIGQGSPGVAVESHTCYIQEIFGQAGGTQSVWVNSAGKLGFFSSSRRFKDEIKPMDKTSEVIYALKPVSFRYKAEIEKTRPVSFGLIAEEVEKISPDLVQRGSDGQVNTVRYECVNAMLLNEFLKEHKKVEEQQASIAELKSTVALQQKGMEVLTAQLKEQASQIQKVSAQLELNKTAPRTVDNK